MEGILENFRNHTGAKKIFAIANSTFRRMRTELEKRGIWLRGTGRILSEYL